MELVNNKQINSNIITESEEVGVSGLACLTCAAFCVLSGGIGTGPSLIALTLGGVLSPT